MALTSEQDSKAGFSAFTRIPWLRLILALILSIIVVIFVGRNVNFSDVQSAYTNSNKIIIVLSTFLILVTLIAKAWRWQLMFVPDSRRPKLGPIVHALALGQFFNLVFPMRMGDIIRVYSLNSQTNSGKARGFSTLVIEKMLEIIGLLLSLLLLIPFIVIPKFIVESGYPLVLVTAFILIILIILTRKTERVIAVVNKISSILPEPIQRKITEILIAGLEGLDALRNWKLSLGLGLISFTIVILAIAVPLLLFSAFDIPLGAPEAVLLNAVVSLSMVPPSTPGKIVVFEGLVILMLRRFGIEDESLSLSYAIIYHLVVIIPPIILGGLAFLRGGYRMSAANDQNAPTSTA